MAKVTLDKETFKALASDTRLDILRTLDGKKLGLNDISKATNLNKATLHEHLSKLNQVGLVKKKEREGHKWVYYKLTWKGENLLHPENTKIVVLFTITFIALWAGIIQMIWYVKGTVMNIGYDAFYENGAAGDGMKTGTNDSVIPAMDSIPENSRLLLDSSDGAVNVLYQNPLFLYIALACFIIFTIVLCVAIWRLWKNKTPKL
ncbi:MAG: winged helix-turn-helix transcriptional regulator [Thermoplasmatales archaeon]|nr:winged helix-turn-helix transcriptional regulator [Thermoplasmatales archaeon]